MLPPHLEASRALNQFDQELMAMGLFVEQTSDFDYVEAATNDSEKPYTTVFMATDRNVFTEGNCFWLLVRDEGNFLVGTIACRRDVLGDEKMESTEYVFVSDLFHQQYTGGAELSLKTLIESEVGNSRLDLLLHERPGCSSRHGCNLWISKAVPYDCQLFASSFNSRSR